MWPCPPACTPVGGQAQHLGYPGPLADTRQGTTPPFLFQEFLAGWAPRPQPNRSAQFSARSGSPTPNSHQSPPPPDGVGVLFHKQKPALGPPPLPATAPPSSGGMQIRLKTEDLTQLHTEERAAAVEVEMRVIPSVEGAGP